MRDNRLNETRARMASVQAECSPAPEKMANTESAGETTDRVIREALIRKLRANNRRGNAAVLIQELGIGHGQARADLVVVGRDLHGIEIKSDRDTLARLVDQKMTYGKVFDRVTLVVGFRHAARALAEAEEWWGVQLVSLSSSLRIVFHEARRARRNPSVVAESVAGLLWRDEALELLSALEPGHRFSHSPRKEIYRKLAEVADLACLRDAVRQQLKARTTRSIVLQSASCGD